MLNIAAGRLQYGEQYAFTVMLTSTDLVSEGRFSLDTAVVSVVASGIEVTGVLGPDRVVSLTDPLTLTAAPTDTMVVTFPWSYLWSCVGKCAGDLQQCASDAAFATPCELSNAAAVALFDNANTVTLPAGALAPSSVYKFACAIEREPRLIDGQRSKTAFVRIAMPEAGLTVVDVQVTPTSGSTVLNREVPLELLCTHTLADTVPVLYTWTRDAGEMLAGLTLVNITETINGAQSVRNPRLNLMANRLVGDSYTFSCKVEEADPNDVTRPLLGGAFGEAQ
eukprot:623301-Pyramimonas_sp.AAC.1